MTRHHGRPVMPTACPSARSAQTVSWTPCTSGKGVLWRGGPAAGRMRRDEGHLCRTVSPLHLSFPLPWLLPHPPLLPSTEPSLPEGEAAEVAGLPGHHSSSPCCSQTRCEESEESAGLTAGRADEQSVREDVLGRSCWEHVWPRPSLPRTPTRAGRAVHELRAKNHLVCMSENQSAMSRPSWWAFFLSFRSWGHQWRRRLPEKCPPFPHKNQGQKVLRSSQSRVVTTQPGWPWALILPTPWPWEVFCCAGAPSLAASSPHWGGAQSCT